MPVNLRVKWLLIPLTVLMCAGCNLNKAVEMTPTLDAPPATLMLTEAAALIPTVRPTRTPISFGATTAPTLLPLVDTSVDVLGTPQPTLFPVTSAPPLGTLCQVYTTYSGVDPRNNLSLRVNASVSAPQIFRVPTGQQVYLVPGSGEIEADGYHWLNVIYVQSPQMRYQGWMARDSFSANGVRDPSIATLRLMNAQAGC